MATLITTYNTDGTWQVETVPDANDFIFLHVPKDLNGDPRYTELRDKLISHSTITTLRKGVEWINESVKAKWPTFYGSSNFMLDQKAEWWQKVPEVDRTDFFKTMLFSYKIPEADNPEIAAALDCIYMFPKTDLVELLTDVGGVLVFAIDYTLFLVPEFVSDEDGKTLWDAYPNAETGAASESGEHIPAREGGDIRECSDGAATCSSGGPCCGAEGGCGAD